MTVSLAKPGFAFGEVVAVLSNLFGVHEGMRATFVGRVQQLQRAGIPANSNFGRGAKIRYVNWQLADFALAMDLLDAGITPAALAIYFGNAERDSMGVYQFGGYGWHVQESMKPDKKDMFMLLRFNALGYFARDPEKNAEAKASPFDLTYMGRTADTLIDELSVGPAVIINMTERLRALRRSVEEVLPNLIDEITFYPTRSGMRDD